MRKLGMCTLVLMIGAGMLVMGGCSDSDTATSALPKSAAAYMGSNNPAVIDSTTAGDYDNLNNDVLSGVDILAVQTDYIDSGSGSETTEGDISGTFTETWSWSSSQSPTKDTNTESGTGVYSDYQDSGVGWPYVVVGSGDYFYTGTQSQDFDGVEPVPAGIGTFLGSYEIYYVNYNKFAESTLGSGWLPYDELRGGWANMEYSYLDTTGVWSGIQNADFGYNDFLNDAYTGLLNSAAAADYDGSVTALVASGTLCEEGIGIEGCLDYEMDLQWSGDAEPTSWPEDGTTKISTVGAAAMYDYSAYAGTCALYSLDSDNNGAYDFSTTVGTACP